MTAVLTRGDTAVPPAPALDQPNPRWARAGLLALLAGTAVFYLWGLSASGYANSFYAAAAQAGSVSWKAFFYGASDAAGSITVDKPPASLWVMGLSVRLFGLSSWSILVPQALEGVATVGVLYATVARRFGATAGLLSGLVLALTPVAALMFRYDNPDALLTLLLVAAAWALLRGVEDGRTRWLVLAGVFLGLGFLTKQLQAFLVLPALALAYLVAGPVRLRTRLLQLLAGGAALVASAGWWVAIVELVPAADRPYIGGSQHNSILELTLGYNGLGRITGAETGSVGGGGGGPAGTGNGRWGITGISRMFTAEFGGQIAWLLPAALILFVAGLVLARRAPRTDGRRASYLVWGLWLLVSGLTFSFMAGIIHPYYTVALAPAVAALVGSGAMQLWRHRHSWWAAGTLAATVALTAVWAYVLLARSPDFVPWLRVVVLIGGLAAAAGLLLHRLLPRRAAVVVGLVALLSALAGQSAYAAQTVGTAHTGSIVSAGPQVADGRGGPGGFAGRGPGGFGGQPGDLPGRPGGPRTPGTGATQLPAAGMPQPGFGFAPGGQAPTGGRGGGLLNGSTPNAELTALLKNGAAGYTWVAAAVGSQNASGYQLASEQPVMPIGGFNGSDPSPTLAQFQQDVAAGKIHYFLGGGRDGNPGGGPGGAMGGSRASAEISTWVQQHYSSSTVGSTTVYDLTRPTG